MSNTKFYHEFYQLLQIKNTKEIIKLFEENDRINVNTKNSFGWTPLMQAVYQNHYELVDYLINIGADINLLNGFGASALSIAVQHDNIKIIKLLINSGAIISNDNQIDPILITSMKGNVKLTKLILEHYDYDINKIHNYFNVTALEVSIYNLKQNTCELLLNNGANPRSIICNLLANSPWKNDMIKNNSEKYNNILKCIQNILVSDKELKLRDEILKCVVEDNMNKLESILECIKNKESVMDILTHALFLAVSLGYEKVTSLILRFGVDCNIFHQTDGKTPLMLAAIHGNIDILKLLINNGADVSLRCIYTGYNAFEFASVLNNIPSDIMRLLAQRTILAISKENMSLKEAIISRSNTNWLFPPSTDETKRAKSLPPGSPNCQTLPQSPVTPRKITPKDLMKSILKTSEV